MGEFLLIFLLLVGLILGGVILKSSANPNESSENDTTRSLGTAEDTEEIISLAKEFESNRQWNRAREAWSRLLEVEPERNDAYFRRGLVSYRQDRYEEAIEDFGWIHENEDDPPHQLYLYTARAHQNLSNLEQAYQSYKEFFERTEPNTEVRKEMAKLAFELEYWNQARKHYEYLKNNGPKKLTIDAHLALAEIAFERDLFERLEEEIQPLINHEQDQMTDEQKLRFWYLNAHYHEWKDEQEKADRFYRKIYQKNPDFRNVQEVVEEQILNLDSDSLVQKLQRMDQKTFEDFCGRITSGMNYEVIKTQWSNPEELSLITRDQSMALGVSQVLFEFKKWQEQAGELAIKEFEFRIVENRYDQGYFVNPSGYKAGAQNYARGHEKINLMDAPEIIDHLQDWYRNGG